MADQDRFHDARHLGREDGSDMGLDQEAERTLEALLSAAQMQPPQMSQAFEQGLLADALAHMPSPTDPTPPMQVKPTGLAGLAEAFGGWIALSGGAGGAVCAGLVGLWLGFASPAALETMTANLVSFTTSESANEVMFDSFDLAIVLQDGVPEEEW